MRQPSRTDDINAIITKARQELAAEGATREAQTQAWIAEAEEAKARFRRLGACMRPATRSDYLMWLAGFLRNGGRVTHAYDRPFVAGDEWFYVHSDCCVPALYGAFAARLIVAAGVSISPESSQEGFGHSDLYYMDGFHSSGWVPLFANTCF